MKTYTVAACAIRCGIELTDGKIVLGEEGRGRKLKRVNPPVGSVVEDNVLVAVPGDKGAAILIRDHSGFRGSWELDAPGCRVVAEGYCAQGTAGYMGGGPEYLLVAPNGAIITIRRSGRLYGSPATLRLMVVDGHVIREDDTTVEW